MPWAVKKTASKKKPFAIVKKKTGEVVGKSSTKKKAEASVKARYAAMEKEMKGHMKGMEGH